MSHVTIRFRPFFKPQMFSGVKRCTARTKIMGRTGDTFEAFGATFQIMHVSEEPLRFVADLWYCEGCDSPLHFIEVWNSIHPRKKFQPEQRVFLHWFKKVTSEDAHHEK